MKINDIINEGYFVLPTMDRERYTDLSKEGLEGPFMTRSGKVVYYDPKEGKYYDRDSDMYLSHEEYEAYDSPQTNVNEAPYDLGQGARRIGSAGGSDYPDMDFKDPNAGLSPAELRDKGVHTGQEYGDGRRLHKKDSMQAVTKSGKAASRRELDKREADKLVKSLKAIETEKLNPAQKKSLLRKINGVIKSSAKAAKNFGTGGKILGILGMLGSAGLELLDPSIKESINKVKQHILGESLGNKVTINEVQYILKAVQGFTVTLGNMEDPRQETQLNLADKKIDMSGAQGITITDELSPAERTNMLRRAKGAVVDVQVSNMR